MMNVAARTRIEKEIHPERFCSEPRCLWALRSGPCPRHAERYGLVPVERVEAMQAYGMAAARDSIGRRPPRSRFVAKLAVPQPELGVGASGPVLMSPHVAVDPSTGMEHRL